jgi:hypothetical protein
MRLTRFLVSIAIGTGLGVMMLLVGGMFDHSPPPKCPHCAVLTQPYGCHDAQAVQGGYICN